MAWRAPQPGPSQRNGNIPAECARANSLVLSSGFACACRRFSAVGEEVAGTLKINVESIMDLKEMETGRLRFVPDDDYGRAALAAWTAGSPKKLGQGSPKGARPCFPRTLGRYAAVTQPLRSEEGGAPSRPVVV